jgi:DNA uptake protein ComE-like DNA-binding protein
VRSIGKVREAISVATHPPDSRSTTFHFGAAETTRLRMKKESHEVQRIVATGLALVFALVASAASRLRPSPLRRQVNINTATAQQLTVLPGVGSSPRMWTTARSRAASRTSPS